MEIRPPSSGDAAIDNGGRTRGSRLGIRAAAVGAGAAEIPADAFMGDGLADDPVMGDGVADDAVMGDGVTDDAVVGDGVTGDGVSADGVTDDCRTDGGAAGGIAAAGRAGASSSTSITIRPSIRQECTFAPCRSVTSNVGPSVFIATTFRGSAGGGPNPASPDRRTIR
jgi:hypothetical protein